MIGNLQLTQRGDNVSNLPRHKRPVAVPDKFDGSKEEGGSCLPDLMQLIHEFMDKFPGLPERDGIG